MEDREFDKLLEDLKTSLNPPPETPRERMWQRIDTARVGRRDRNSQAAPRPRRPGLVWLQRRSWAPLTAAAAILLLGVVIGRWTGPQHRLTAPATVDGTGITAPGPTPRPAPGNLLLYQTVAAELFGRADVLLTDFRVNACLPGPAAAADVAALPAWAGGMLTQTRLLLGSPLAADPETRDLLLDLELVLAQIAGLDLENCARDAAWIRDALDSRSTLDRLRLARSGRAPGDPL